MIVRSVDASNDWNFGKGANDYRTGLQCVTQMISTNLRFFLNDCFFEMNQGIDWFNLLGGKDLVALKLAITTTILNTDDVTGVLELSTNLDKNRNVTISYQVSTSYGTVVDTYTYQVAG